MRCLNCDIINFIQIKVNNIIHTYYINMELRTNIKNKDIKYVEYIIIENTFSTRDVIEN